MSKRSSDINSSMYSGEPCDKCGGPTLLIGQGSIWCPSESCVPGGHFVRRVAFARPPSRDSITRSDWAKQPPKRRPLAPVERRASVPTSAPTKVVEDDGFDKGMDGFVKS